MSETNNQRIYDRCLIRVGELEAENEKLRELVLHMHTCLEHYELGDTISCEQCPYDNETWGCDYERLMAELGIEADAVEPMAEWYRRHRDWGKDG